MNPKFVNVIATRFLELHNLYGYNVANKYVKRTVPKAKDKDLIVEEVKRITNHSTDED